MLQDHHYRGFMMSVVHRLVVIFLVVVDSLWCFPFARVYCNNRKAAATTLAVAASATVNSTMN